MDKLLEPADAAEIAAARAKLASANENLADTKAGPGVAELAAAEAALAAAREGYQEILDGQSEADEREDHDEPESPGRQGGERR